MPPSCGNCCGGAKPFKSGPRKYSPSPTHQTTMTATGQTKLSVTSPAPILSLRPRSAGFATSQGSRLPCRNVWTALTGRAKRPNGIWSGKALMLIPRRLLFQSPKQPHTAPEWMANRCTLAGASKTTAPRRGGLCAASWPAYLAGGKWQGGPLPDLAGRPAETAAVLTGKHLA